jgi:hypothetical protein
MSRKRPPTKPAVVPLFGLYRKGIASPAFHKARIFNHHPACVCGLRRAVHNFAEPVQLEFEDLVIASPSQVDTQSAWGNVFVYAHNERCVLNSFHLNNFVFFCSPTPWPDLRRLLIRHSAYSGEPTSSQ